MDPIVYPSHATTRELLNFYRRNKIHNRHIAMSIQYLSSNQNERNMRCKAHNELENILNERETQLSVLGRKICAALKQITDPIDQLMFEMRYLDLLSLREISEETEFSISTVSYRIRRAINQVQITM